MFNVIRLSCRRKGGQIPYSANTNVVMPSFVTCYARLRLYEALISLPLKRVLYYDMDSNINHSAYSDELIECRPFFGQLKNELYADECIVEFCSTGPKCYSYITNKKIDVSDLLNHESMLEIIDNPGIDGNL